MPEKPRSDPAAATLATVRRQLLDAAAFGKTLSPDQLEHIAARLGECLRAYAQAVGEPGTARPLHPRSRRGYCGGREAPGH
ncbi:DUF6374 family protein [Nocardia thailandica]